MIDAIRAAVGATVVLALLLASGCRVTASRRPGLTGDVSAVAACRDGESQQQRSTIYFGAAIPNSSDTVDDAEWSTFLADTVTPKFPDGLTWLEGSGQWRGADGAIVSEHSRMLVLLHADDEKTRAAISEIRATYRSRFMQESTLHERSVVCASF